MSTKTSSKSASSTEDGTSDGSTPGSGTTQKRKPIKTIRVGDVSASVWARDHQGTTYYSCSFERSYKTRDGAYGYSKSFDMDDLGRLVTAAQEAHEYLTNLQDPDTMLPGTE